MASLTPRHQNMQHEPNVDVATAGAEKTGGGCSKYSAKAMESGEFSNFFGKRAAFPSVQLGLVPPVRQDGSAGWEHATGIRCTWLRSLQARNVPRLMHVTT